MTNDLRERVEKIVTYHGDEGTSGYLLSPSQIQQIVDLIREEKVAVLEEVKEKQFHAADGIYDVGDVVSVEAIDTLITSIREGKENHG